MSSPYANWWQIAQLEEEARRLTRLPSAQHNATVIKAWRKRQVYLISRRINELSRKAQYAGA